MSDRPSYKTQAIIALLTPRKSAQILDPEDPARSTHPIELGWRTQADLVKLLKCVPVTKIPFLMKQLETLELVEIDKAEYLVKKKERKKKVYRLKRDKSTFAKLWAAMLRLGINDLFMRTEYFLNQSHSINLANTYDHELFPHNHCLDPRTIPENVVLERTGDWLHTLSEHQIKRNPRLFTLWLEKPKTLRKLLKKLEKNGVSKGAAVCSLAICTSLAICLEDDHPVNISRAAAAIDSFELYVSTETIIEQFKKKEGSNS